MKARAVTVLGAWAFVDQVISSATNFLAGVVVARTVGPSGFGSFTLAFGSWLLLLGVTRSMLVQPFTVSASGLPKVAWREATGATAASVLVFGSCFGLGAIITGLLVGSGTPTGSAFIVLGIFATPLALQDFWRYAAFSLRRPKAAAMNDAVWAVAQVAALVLAARADSLTPATAIGAWGLGASAGAVFGLLQFRVPPSLGRRQRAFIRANAPLAGWFGIANASFVIGSYGSQLLVGVGAGRSALGGLSGATTLMSPAQLVASSAESIMLPFAARTAKADDPSGFSRMCKTYSIALAGFFAVAGILLTLFGPVAISALYGEAYERFASILPAIVASVALGGLASGIVIGFRALGEGRRLAELQVVSSVTKLSMVAASVPFGLVAAAWALALAELIRTVLFWLAFGGAVERGWTSEGPARLIASQPAAVGDP